MQAFFLPDYGEWYSNDPSPAPKPQLQSVIIENDLKQRWQNVRDVTLRCPISRERYATWCDRDCMLTWMLSKHQAGTWTCIVNTAVVAASHCVI